jgi:hypothetical protein
LLMFMCYCRKYVTMSMTCGGSGTNMSLLRIQLGQPVNAASGEPF